MYQKWDKSPIIMKVSTHETPHYLVLILVINFTILVEPPVQKSGAMKYIALLHNRLKLGLIIFFFFLLFLLYWAPVLFYGFI